MRPITLAVGAKLIQKRLFHVTHSDKIARKPPEISKRGARQAFPQSRTSPGQLFFTLPATILRKFTVKTERLRVKRSPRRGRVLPRNVFNTARRASRTPIIPTRSLKAADFYKQTIPIFFVTLYICAVYQPVGKNALPRTRAIRAH